MGFLPNTYRLFLHRPLIAQALAALHDAVMNAPSSSLPPKLKHKCSALASKMIEALSALRPLPVNEAERACFDFIIAASHDAAGVSEEIYARLKAHLSPPQIVELVSVLGFWKMYNTMHVALKVPIEKHLQDAGQSGGIP
jgi:alkylhydroperoxidase family enzyme